MAKFGLPGGKRNKQPQEAVEIASEWSNILVGSINGAYPNRLLGKYGQPLVLSGTTRYVVQNGVARSAATYAGTDRIILPNDDLFKLPSRDFTIVCGVRLDSLSVDQYPTIYAVRNDTALALNFAFGSNTTDWSGGRVGVQIGATLTVGTSGSAKQNAYAIYAVEVNATTASLYVNGVLDTSAANGHVASSTIVPAVLNRSTGARGLYNGKLTFLHLFDGNLGSQRQKALYENPWQVFQPRKRQIYVDVASGAQNLSPGLYSDADTFYSATVSPGSVALTPSLYVDSDTFYAATVSHGLTAGLFADADTFYAATVTPGSVSLTPGLYSDADTFYAASVTPGAVNVAPGLYSDADTFYAATVSADGSPQTLTPALYADADTFYAATVAPGAVNLAPSIYTDADTFYAATVAAGYNLQPAAFADADTFYAPAVSGGQAVLSPGLFIDADIFYSATVISPTLLSAPRTLISHTQTASRSNIQTARRP